MWPKSDQLVEVRNKAGVQLALGHLMDLILCFLIRRRGDDGAHLRGLLRNY